jgi:hypothetical protein
MTEPAQTRVSDVAPVHPRAPRSERRFFELVGPALKNQPLTFLCEDREYRYGSSAAPTVIRISDSGVFDRILTEGNLGLAECYMDKKVEVVHGSLEHFVVSLIRADVAVGHHLGEFAFQRAKGLLRGSGCEEHQIERAACRAPAALAGAPIP